MSVPAPNVSDVQQLSFGDVDPSGGFADGDPLAGLPLADTTFVVVDLETTGGRATASTPGGSDHDAITEIGAVKIRGGVVLGELGTLVDPGRSIPPQIVALTGITSAMVYDAPRIDSVLPAFLEFSRGAVLVAHNAGFDIGFLRAAAQRLGLPWPRPQVLCTVKLARRVLTRDEAPSVKLSALARLFGASTTPTHRALDDARATVDVLHGLIERVGNQGCAPTPSCGPTSPTRPPRSDASGIWPTACRRYPVCTCSAVPATRRSTSAPRWICAAGSASTSPARTRAPDEGDGGIGHPGRPCRVRA